MFLEEACRPSPCGQNTNCEVVAGRPTCSCIKGYVGNPLSGCRHECESDGECGNQEYCKEFKCQSACDQCGISAQCSRVTNHRAVCECPKVCILTLCKADTMCFIYRFFKTELHLGQSIHWMQSWMLWRSWLSSRSTSLFLWHLQKSMWRRLWHWCWL